MASSNGVLRNFVRGGGVSKIQLRIEDRGNGDLGTVAPLVRGSRDSCNFVQEISFHIVLIFGTLRLFMMTTNLFVIANVKQLRTGCSFRILLPFFPEHFGVLAS